MPGSRHVPGVSLDPYPELPDTAMGTASDDGEPGERLELSEADNRLLNALSRPEPPVVTAVEDQPRTVRSARDDGVAPVPGPSGRGPLEPVFQEPAG